MHFNWSFHRNQQTSKGAWEHFKGKGENTSGMMGKRNITEHGGLNRMGHDRETSGVRDSSP